MVNRLRSTIPALIVAALTLITVLLIIAVISDNPLESCRQMLLGPFSSSLAFGNFLESSALLMIAGLAAVFAFQAGLFNLGGEGQAMLGGLSATVLALTLPEMPRVIALMGIIAVGMVSSGTLAGISGILKMKWNMNEFITTFLVAAAVLPAGNVLLSGVLQDTSSYLITAPALPDSWLPTPWLPPSRLNVIILWALLLVSAAYVFFNYTSWGYAWRLQGMDTGFARYGGFQTGRTTILALVLSGALYGASGTAALLGTGRAIQGFTSGLGWNGLATAMIANRRPEFLPIAALVYAWLIYGVESAAISAGFPLSLSGVVQGSVFLLVSVRFIRQERG